MAEVFSIIGACLIPFILGYLGLKAAKKGDKKAKIFMIVMDVLVVMATFGSIVGDGVDLGVICYDIVAAVFTILIISAQKNR